MNHWEVMLCHASEPSKSKQTHTHTRNGLPQVYYVSITFIRNLYRLHRSGQCMYQRSLDVMLILAIGWSPTTRFKRGCDISLTHQRQANFVHAPLRHTNVTPEHWAEHIHRTTARNLSNVTAKSLDSSNVD